jgi:hypothetical protein
MSAGCREIDRMFSLYTPLFLVNVMVFTGFNRKGWPW